MMKILIPAMGLCLLVVTIAGCARDHYVIASSGTTLGLDISQTAGSQTPQIKFGYNRAELAYVPTNRFACKATDGTETDCSLNGGAADSAEVMMELHYGGGVSATSKQGIYQRLAVGKEAVKTPGAAFMFARQADGTIDAASAEKVAAAVRSVDATSTEALDRRKPLRQAYLSLANTKKAQFDEAAVSGGFEDFRSFLMASPSLQQINTVEEALKTDKTIADEIARFQ